MTHATRHFDRLETPSPAACNPWVRLAAGICRQAAADLRSPDPALALDALEFWLSEDAAVLLDAIGFSVDLTSSGFVKLFEVEYGPRQGLFPARLDLLARADLE
jgi:hypothetical protein